MSANNRPTMWSPKFTDEDLEKLKKCVVPETQKLAVGLFMWDTHSSVAIDLAGLLERLRWAEKCAELCATDENCCNIPELGENDTSPYYLWRKAAGKED